MTHDFPPLGGGGVQRPLKLCRHLPALGYEPVVVTGTGASGHWQPRDDELGGELSGEIGIYRLPGPEPDPGRWERRAERWLGLRDRWTRWWISGLVEQGELAAAAAPVDLIYAWMQPYQTAFAARILAARLRVPWIAEMGDPWAFDEMVLYPTRLHRRADQARMGSVLGSASGVIMSTPEAAQRVARAFPALARRVSTLPFGYNAEDFERPPSVDRSSSAFRIVHTGTLHTEAGRRRIVSAFLGGAAQKVDILPRSHVFLLQAVERLLREQPELGSRVEVHLAGALSAADQAVAAQHSFVRLHGFVPHRQVLELLQSADLLFLPMHDLPSGSRAGLVPGKTYEYLAAGRPILAAVPEGDARDLLAQFERVSLCRPKDVDAMRETIERLLHEQGEQQPSANASRDLGLLQGLERRAITAELGRLFDRVVTSSPARKAAIRGAAA